MDLHGLPPTAEQIEKFANDPAPDAYEKLIDELLASPRYGEKWGRHWLDLARYGDTGGFEQDPYLLYAWRYRDYVIDSFNNDKPYDRFVKEQIAGDELYPDDPASMTGTGFYTVGPNRDMLFKVEDTNRFETLIDMVDTTGSVFLGLTVGCARCHDHKFDPIPQRDYYGDAGHFPECGEDPRLPAIRSRPPVRFAGEWPDRAALGDRRSVSSAGCRRRPGRPGAGAAGAAGRQAERRQPGSRASRRLPKTSRS